ncbi:MAG: DHH family phosphoesterase [Nitrososphaeria archaeon]
MEPSFSNIDAIDLFKVKKVCIITHRLADVDAFCASYALAELLKEGNEVLSIDMIFPGGLDSKADELRKHFGVEASCERSFNRFDLVIVVDAGSPKLLNEYFDILKAAGVPKMLLDHHHLLEDSKSFYKYFFVNEKVTSSSELVLSLFKRYGSKPSELISNVLLLGILFDTKHLLVASEDTIKNVSSLIDYGATLRWGETLLSQKKDRSEVIARMKALSRINLYESDDIIICIVEIGSFHASVAKFLVDAGCDIVVSYGVEEGMIKGSLRGSNEIGKNENFALNVLAEALAKKFSGVGGGHRLASSFNIQCERQGFESALISLLQEMLSTKIRKLPLK